MLTASCGKIYQIAYLANIGIFFIKHDQSSINQPLNIVHLINYVMYLVIVYTVFHDIFVNLVQIFLH